jgi:hypothetical protein
MIQREAAANSGLHRYGAAPSAVTIMVSMDLSHLSNNRPVLNNF